MMDRELAVAGIVIGDDRARLQGDACVAAEIKLGFGHIGGICQRRFHVALVHQPLPAKVVPVFVPDQRRVGLQRRLHIGDRRQFLVFDADQFQRVFGLGAGFGGDGGHRLALPAGAVHGQRILRRRAHALQMGEDADIGLTNFGHVLAGDDSDDAGRRLRLGGVDGQYFGVGVGRAQIGAVQHTRQTDIVGEIAAPVQQFFGVGPGHAPPDIAVGPVVDGEDGVRFQIAHQLHLSLATVSMASTMV